MQILRIAAVLVGIVASPIFNPVATDAAWASEQQQRESRHAPRLIDVKYRPTPVDVADPRFEQVDTSRSSFVNGAWYDESNGYMVISLNMIIGLNEFYYHYCRMPREAWDLFRFADSFGRHYNEFIKRRYDCRIGGVPNY